MITIPALEAVVLVLLGGLFGWLLGRLPDRWVYAVAAVTVIIGIIVVGGVA